LVGCLINNIGSGGGGGGGNDIQNVVSLWIRIYEKYVIEDENVN
jgi:hypothetical protein